MISDSDSSPAAAAARDHDEASASWDATMADLRARYPKASDGILFCVHKLQQNPDLTIPDFRDEAALHGIKLGGRALHSAKVLLGLEAPAKRRTKAELADTDAPPAKPAPARRARAAANSSKADDGRDVEGTLIAAVQQIQDAATAESRRLREAMREAVTILQRALDGLD